MQRKHMLQSVSKMRTTGGRRICQRRLAWLYLPLFSAATAASAIFVDCMFGFLSKEMLRSD